MYEPNVAKVLSLLKPTDVVLDVGGGACPLNRANWILDGHTYDDRGKYGAYFGGTRSQGPAEESFTRDTWIQRDICSHEPYPFADKSIDFVICSHTLEDLRDPIWPCSEMLRIAKAGYFETPSRIAEQSRGWEDPNIAGLSHHRWLVEMGEGHVKFIHKPHFLHSRGRYMFTPRFNRSVPLEKKVTWMFWSESFSYEEFFFPTMDAYRDDLEAFVQKHAPRSDATRAAERAAERAEGFARRIARGIQRRIPSFARP